MKIIDLIKDIQDGKYDVITGGMLKGGYCVLPKDDIITLLVELNKRRKLMSKPRCTE